MAAGQSGSCGQLRAGRRGVLGQHLPGPGEAGAGAQQLQGLVHLGVVGDRAGQQHPQPVGVGPVALQRVEHRQGEHALAQVRAGRLARAVDGEVMSMMSSLIWNAVPIAAPNRCSDSTCSGVQPENMPP